VEEMAQAYLEELRPMLGDAVPQLLGWSMGGLIAVEMHHRLAAEGIALPPPILLDTRLPGDLPDPRKLSRSELLTSFAQHLGSLLEPELIDFMERAADEEESLAALVDDARARDLLALDLDGSTVQRLFDVFQANLHAAHSYRPRSMSGELVYLRPEHTSSRPSDPRDFGWSQHFAGSVRVVDVPGDHFSALAPIHAQSLAVILDRITAGISTEDA
jgi:thioesterase domain-containing protein